MGWAHHQFVGVDGRRMGILTYLLVDCLAALLEQDEDSGHGQVVRAAGLGAFMYLEVLDASFSFDGVIGAFAITKDIVIIMSGLGIGAMFVRSDHHLSGGKRHAGRICVSGARRPLRDWRAGADHAGVDEVAHPQSCFTGLIGIALILLSVWVVNPL